MIHNGEYKMDTGLDGQHMVLTGASGGIGIEIVKQFLKEGGKMTAAYHTSPRELDLLVEAYPNHLQIMKTDVTAESDVELLFRQANSHHGRVDILVANAGIANALIKVQDMTLEQWNRTIGINLTGAFLCAKYFFKSLAMYEGDIASLVLIGSTAGVFGEAGFCDYATSKSGLHGLMMSLKNEIPLVASRGRVNLVNPGWTQTSMADGLMDDDTLMKKVLQTIPMRKIAQPHDIAAIVLFLVSEKLAGHVSGQSVTVAGGMEGRILYDEDEIALDR
jgi:NAD(P)-dependent dehydrogenase (short-subunit alcohol dehydrogenase family)